jgi:predicted transcriptional regulator of viral defense system
MPSPGPEKTLAELVDSLQKRGRYTLIRPDAMQALGISANAFRKAAQRLARSRRLVRIRGDFHAIVPLDHFHAGITPPEWFIDDLMKHLGVRYYIGGLTAATYHGATHQRAMVFQVVAERQLRAVRVAGQRIQFLYKKSVAGTSTQALKVPSGYLPLSTPEATAIDLLRYAPRVGELNHILTVLQEMGEVIRPRMLVQAAEADGNLAYAQRLGWLLEQTRFANKAGLLAGWCARQAPLPARLQPGVLTRDCPRDRRWNLWVNTTVEGDLS